MRTNTRTGSRLNPFSLAALWLLVALAFLTLLVWTQDAGTKPPTSQSPGALQLRGAGVRTSALPSSAVTRSAQHQIRPVFAGMKLGAAAVAPDTVASPSPYSQVQPASPRPVDFVCFDITDTVGIRLMFGVRWELNERYEWYLTPDGSQMCFYYERNDLASPTTGPKGITAP